MPVFIVAIQPNLLIIPRRPTNLFYNVSTPAEWVSEYNHFYGPGRSSRPYWDHDLSYSEILDKESEVWLSYLLKWDLDPLMFHQSNTRAYSGTPIAAGRFDRRDICQVQPALQSPRPQSKRT